MNRLAEFSIRDGYLVVKVPAPWTIQTAQQVIDETRREAERQSIARVLFDLTQWAKPDTEFTRFRSGEYLAKVLPPPFKIAAYGNANAITKFGENTAVNRGAWFRVFPDEEAAIRWLVESRF